MSQPTDNGRTGSARTSDDSHLPGRLIVVATPIGNLRDLSPRAREALELAHVIAAEDTRHTQGLLQAIGVSKPMVSLHAHNEAQRLPELLARLGAGEQVVLVSDAGTPLLSDPGFQLVDRASREGFEVSTVPGPSAITAALAICGLPVGRFSFEGFLPARARERRRILAGLANESRTMVFFEAPHRIVETLADMSAELGGARRAAAARELTKMHETVYRGTLGELEALAARDSNFQRGELTLVVEGAAERSPEINMTLLKRAVELLVGELPPARAAAIAAQLAGASRRAAYELVMRASGSTRDE